MLFQGLVPKYSASQVQCCTRWATEQVYYLRKAIHMELVMWCKCENKKKCPMAKVFRGHNIVLSKEPVGKELWEEINRKYQEHSAWGKAKEILISNVTLKMSSITTIYWCIKIDHDGNCTNQSVKVTDSDSTNPDVVKRDPVPETQHHRNSHTNSH